MIVRFTTRQFNALSLAIEANTSPAFREYWFNLEKVTEGKMHDVSMIPDAWVDLRDVLLKLYEKSHPKPSLLAAMTRVFRACIHHAGHPAFAGQAMAERQLEVLPGWQDYEDRPVRPLVPTRVWSRDEMERWAVVMIPKYRREGQLWITEWKAMPSTDIEPWLQYDREVRRA